MQNPTAKLTLPFLGYRPEDIPKMTNGAVSRTRVFQDMASGRLRAKKIGGKHNIITPEEARRYIESFPDRPTRATAAQAEATGTA